MAQSREDEILPAAEEQQSEGPGLECAASVHGDRVLFPCASPECVPYVVPRGIGFIESIQLENFLSYATLGPVKFGTHINFVVGHGGRSALLTALIIGLGGKSLGTSLKDFVKDGATSANISITLRNSGIYAFKSDVYGDSITVQRCISVDEGPSYKLKDQGGNHVSSEKEELTAILEHFMIQVDNPAVVLLQHVGKQFVCARNEGDRYRLFLKSTKLEHMREEYSELLAKKARSQNELDQAREEVERLGYEEAQIGKHFQSRAALREKLEDLKHEMAWALVNETEKDLNNMLIHINFGDQQAEILDQELEASRAKLNEAEQEHRSIQEHLQKLNEEGEALKPKCISARDDAESMQRAYIQVEVALNSSQDELNKLEKVAENINNKIKDTKKSLHLLELEKQRKISVLKEKLKKHREQEELLVQDIKLIHRTVEKDDEEHFRVKKEEAYVQQMLNEGQQQLIQWKEYKSDPLKRFGPYISALLEAIDGAHRQGLFTCKPIGPLGACIRLRDPEFALAVECCLKGRLLDFFCDNQQDKQALQELMTTVYPFGTPRPQIIVSSFECELYDVTERAACHPEYPTVLTALEIDKTVVSNALIDMRHIETVLLIKDNSLAHTMIQGQGLPKNCTKILTACGDEVYEGCYSSCEESRPTYLGDVDLEISNLEKEVENRIGHLSVYQQHVSELEKDMRKNRETMDSHYQYLKELRTKEVNITSQIKDLGNRNESQSKDILILEQEAQEIQGKIQEVEEKMKAQKDKMDSLRQLGIEAEQRFENYKSRCIQLSDVIDSFIEKQNELASEVGTQKESVLRCENNLRHHLKSLQTEKEEMAIKTRELQRETSLAKYMCPERKEVTRTASVLDNEINMLKQTIQSENYTHGSLEEIRRQYQEIKERCIALNLQMKNLKRYLIKLDEMTSQRFVLYHKCRKSLSLQCKMYFQSLLSQWSFEGEMDLNHQNETISITFNPEEGNKAVSTGIQAFSGDKHAFLNFLFMLTLWSFTESPFRCLDSFEDYMDRSQRKIGVDMILRVAQSQKTRQFIVLIPEYLSHLPPSPFIEIIQIPDPETEKKILPSQEIKTEKID